MTIEVGDKLPEVTFRTKGSDGIENVTTADVFSGKTVALFGVPGAFTPTCQVKHLPSYLEAHDDLKAKGVDTIACVAVNDPHVMKAWSEATGSDGRIMFLADGNAEFAKAAGLDVDLSAGGLGTRCKRFSMLVRDGVVKDLHVEPAPGQAVETSAQKILEAL